MAAPRDPRRCRAGSRATSNAATIAAAISALACAQPTPAPERAALDARIEGASRGLEGSVELLSALEGVEAARRREEGPRLLDEVELRVGEEYREEHEVRVVARLPLRRPAELRAQREVYAAETELAVAGLERSALEARARACLPAVEAMGEREQRSLYERWALRREELLAHTEAISKDPLRDLRFALDSKTRLVAREPVPLPAAAQPAPPEAKLPEPREAGRPLVTEVETVRRAVASHHPTVEIRTASAERFRALAARARSRARPYPRFVDFVFEHRSDADLGEGGGGRVAFEIPFGGRARADAGRYDALERQQSLAARAAVEEQLAAARRALAELAFFEGQTQRWRELEALATEAEETAARFWEGRLAGPNVVASLYDEAYAARSAILAARIRAGVAGCSLLATTGVALEDWPRARD